jgi:hypothetical protein
MNDVEVVCEQHRDGVPDEYVIVVPPLHGETAEDTLARKRDGAERHGWAVEGIADGFHAWKEYGNGEGVRDRPYRKDRYFRIR